MVISVGEADLIQNRRSGGSLFHRPIPVGRVFQCRHGRHKVEALKDIDMCAESAPNHLVAIAACGSDRTAVGGPESAKP